MRCYTSAPTENCFYRQEERICEEHAKQHLLVHFPGLQREEIDDALAKARSELFEIALE